MLCISNLRPPASKAGKQPPLSFQFADSLQFLFRETVGSEISMNLVFYAKLFMIA